MSARGEHDCCGTCVYFEATVYSRYVPASCVKRAPVVGRDQSYPRVKWPQPCGDRWCGDYEADADKVREKIESES